jgi:hypothetical protein
LARGKLGKWLTIPHTNNDYIVNYNAKTYSFFAICHADELKIVHFYCYRADTIMPCVYKCQTSRGLAHFEVLERAAKELRGGKKSVRAAARNENIDRMTLKRYNDKK